MSRCAQAGAARYIEQVGLAARIFSSVCAQAGGGDLGTAPADARLGPLDSLDRGRCYRFVKEAARAAIAAIAASERSEHRLLLTGKADFR